MRLKIIFYNIIQNQCPKKRVIDPDLANNLKIENTTKGVSIGQKIRKI